MDSLDDEQQVDSAFWMLRKFHRPLQLPVISSLESLLAVMPLFDRPRRVPKTMSRPARTRWSGWVSTPRSTV